MNALAKIDQPKAMLLDFMADKYGLKPQEFADTVRKTCGLGTSSNEEFAAFLIVAREYNLNPLLREIYAFPKQGGGIVPIVSIDGWINLVNSHPACDGFEFDIEHNGEALVSITCRMYRKDRSRPVVVTEYYDECKRDTLPWKMKHRMLRHKAMIQAARYAFGFSGIYDEDEGAKVAASAAIVAPRDITPIKPIKPPSPPSPPSPGSPNEDADPSEIVTETGESTEAIMDGEPVEGEPFDFGGFFESFQIALAGAKTQDDVEEVWSEFDVESRFEGDDESRQLADRIKSRRLLALHPARAG